ncbi:AAA family ATPase, partial [Pirellulales bacterium]|nr:AAA family ATPase [Pirellulales bacterium]
MHIEKLEIERFGGLQQVTIEDLGQGIEVIHGTNEIGKTSLLEFIRGIFFGFESLFSRGVLDPKVPCSGRLIITTGKGPRGKRERHRFVIERRHEGPNIAALTKESYEDGIVGIGGDEGDVVTVKQLDGIKNKAQRIYLQDLVGDI